MKGRRPLNRHRGDLNRQSSRLKRIFFEVPLTIFARIFKRTPKPIATRGYTGVAGFEAGGGGRRFRGSGAIPNLQSAVLASREQVARSARYAAANMPLAASAADVWVSEAVGAECGRFRKRGMMRSTR